MIEVLGPPGTLPEDQQSRGPGLDELCGRGEPYFDRAFALAGFEYGLPCRGRAAFDRAVAQVKARAVTGAGDGLALDHTAAEQAAAVRAAVVQGVQVIVV